MEILGIDFGGAGIKGNIVDVNTGELKGERLRIETPQPATTQAVADVIKEMTRKFQYNGPIGLGFPAVIQQGVAMTAANIDKSWIGTNVESLIYKATGNKALVINDADAAGFAEVTFGAGKDVKGLILMITIGTGIGTALFTDGKLVPNTELGHIILNGVDAEVYASDASRKRNDLKWGQWGKRLNEYLMYMESLLWPDMIILGGGASKKLHKFADKIRCCTKVVPALMLNEAGIIGAAIAAKKIA